MTSDEKTQPSGDGAEGGSSRFSTGNESSSEALSDVGRYVSEALFHARNYLSAQMDGLRVAIRNVILLTAIGIVAAIIAATILISVSVLLCVGIADGISVMLGGRAWAGDLITAVVVLGSIAVLARIFIGRMVRMAREKTRMEYEQRRARN